MYNCTTGLAPIPPSLRAIVPTVCGHRSRPQTPPRATTSSTTADMSSPNSTAPAHCSAPTAGGQQVCRSATRRQPPLPMPTPSILPATCSSATPTTPQTAATRSMPTTPRSTTASAGSAGRSRHGLAMRWSIKTRSAGAVSGAATPIRRRWRHLVLAPTRSNVFRWC